MKNKKLLGYSLLLCSGIFFSSCFGLRIDAKISAAGKVEAAMQYSISAAALELGLSDSKELYLPLTIDRKVFSDRVLANSGELLSWSVQNKTDSYTVDTRLVFPNMPSFASFLDAEKKMILFTLSENINKLVITVPDSRTGIDPGFMTFLETVFADDSIELSLELPKAPRTNKGFKIEKNKASFSGTSTKFFGNKPGIALELSW